jgi:RNA polymerase sigma-70 factor (ECF subfamily)
MIKQAFDLDEIFRTYRTRIYWLALGICHNERDAEDVAQNTFVKIVRNIHTFEGRSSISTWIYRVAYNEALMFLRKRQRQNRLWKFLNEETEKVPREFFSSGMTKAPDESALDQELKSRVTAAIRRMPIKYRMAVLLHNIEGMSMKETAAVMRLKLNSLKTRLHRAYGMMRGEMSDYLKDKRSSQDADSPACSLVTAFVRDYVLRTLPRAGAGARSLERIIRNSPVASRFLRSYGPAIGLTGALQCRDLPLELKEKIEHVLAGTRTPRVIQPPARIRSPYI